MKENRRPGTVHAHTPTLSTANPHPWKNLVHAARAVSVLAILFVLSACSRYPSEADARAALETKIQKHMSTLVRLHSFKKTNASETFGVYAVDYDADVEFLDDCTFDARTFWASKRTVGELDFDRFEVVQKKKGDRQTVSSAIAFRKTEKGWLPAK